MLPCQHLQTEGFCAWFFFEEVKVGGWSVTTRAIVLLLQSMREHERRRERGAKKRGEGSYPCGTPVGSTNWMSSFFGEARSLFCLYLYLVEEALPADKLRERQIELLKI